MAITRLNNNALGDTAKQEGINFKNLIINGDMSIAQRGTSATGLGNGDNGYHTCDRWRFGESGSPTCEFTQSQSTDVPTGQGFGYSLKYDCTTADASLASSDLIRLQQRIEGQNLQMLKKGTTSAESLTVSFWVKSNKTGTYTLEIQDQDNSRINAKTYTIDSASTWEKKTITFAGDTTGTLDNDNASSLQIHWTLVAGTNFTSGTFSNGTWGGNVNANRVSSSNVNLADNTANEWYITGVQLEVGTAASNFEFLPTDVNLQRCQRYFFKIEDTDETIGGAFAKSASQIIGTLQYPVVMRGAPSATNNSLVIRIDGSDELQNSSSGTFSIEGTSDIATTFKMSGFTIGNTDHGFIAKRNSGSVEFSTEL